MIQIYSDIHVGLQDDILKIAFLAVNLEDTTSINFYCKTFYVFMSKKCATLYIAKLFPFMISFDFKKCSWHSTYLTKEVVLRKFGWYSCTFTYMDVGTYGSCSLITDFTLSFKQLYLFSCNTRKFSHNFKILLTEYCIQEEMKIL